MVEEMSKCQHPEPDAAQPGGIGDCIASCDFGIISPRGSGVFRPHPLFLFAASRNMIGYALSVWAVAAIGGYLPYVGEYYCCSRTTRGCG